MQRFSVTLQDRGSLAPPGIQTLSQSTPFSFHEGLRLRHPGATYNISISKLRRAFARVIDLHEQIRQDFDHKSVVHPSLEEVVRNLLESEVYTSLLDHQRSLIYALREHVDDCYAVLRAFIPPGKGNPKKHQTVDFLRSCNDADLDAFIQESELYLHRRLSPLVNSLKHKQGQLKAVAFYNSQQFRPGYYLEEPDIGGIIGPSTDVHDEGHTAFSFAMDTRLNLFWVYRLSYQLEKRIQCLVKTNSQSDLPHKRAGIADEEWARILKATTDLPRSFFPNEILDDLPSIEWDQEKVDFSLIPANLRIRSFPKQMKITVALSGDGFTTKMRVPYVARNPTWHKRI